MLLIWYGFVLVGPLGIAVASFAFFWSPTSDQVRLEIRVQLQRRAGGEGDEAGRALAILLVEGVEAVDPHARQRAWFG